ncbi:MAG: CaiB/BaiF CoA transferase family protein [Candidatus Dormibacteraceae bacterium]
MKKNSANAAQLFGGVRVIDAGHMLAGPFSSSLLGDFGADVIKIEQPIVGDPVRQLLPHKDGVPLWSKVVSRNKRSVTLDLRLPKGQELFRKLAASADVVIESFRPGTMESWGIGWNDLSKLNNSLIMLRISGFGQTGPYSSRPGFGRFAEAFSGLSNLIGMPDGPPMHAGLPLADYATGLMGWAAVASALYHRSTGQNKEGQCIDLALYESLFRMMEFLVIEYDQLGIVRHRAGNSNPYVAPVNTYRTSDGQWFTFTASTQSIVDRLFAAIGAPELKNDSRYRTNADRVANRQGLDDVVTGWVKEHTLKEIEEIFDAHQLPFARVMDAADILSNPHYKARSDIITLNDSELGTVRMQAPLPKFSRTPGQVRWPGPELGAHTVEVLCGEVGLSSGEVAALREEGVV